ncbi:MAG: dihydrolipoamide succinyltransferase [Gammaproteobacteria bacterium]|nr:dihydrolipoamide succinyltransferase [Gammaproteobacteria bacterium]
MLIEVRVPVLAESVAEATLMIWRKKAGEFVQRGDSLIDIETDKVTLEVAAPNNGILSEILKDDGADVISNEVIARIETKSGAVTGSPQKPASQPQQQSLPVGDIPPKAPKLSPAVRKLLEEYKLDPATIPVSGDDNRLTKEDVLKFLNQDLLTSPSPIPAPSLTEPKSTTASKTVAVSETMMTNKPAVSAPIVSVPTAASSKPGTDNQDALKPATTAPSPAATAVSIPGEESRPQERVPMTRLRRRAAERLLAAQHENAILTTFNEVNMQAVMDLRSQYKDEFEKTHGMKLGFMSFFTRAVSEALKKFPIINASVDDEDIIYHGFFDIGIAVSSPRGLVVPIIRDADLLSFAEIEAKIAEYGTKARDSKLSIEELTGGTFTITNGGIFGSLLSTPILNPPQSAILGMHAIQDRPIAENGSVVIRPMMYLALSYDHRIIDGKEAVQFLVSIKKLIEEPGRLLLQL